MENIPNKETLLVSVKALRSELTAEKTLIEQVNYFDLYVYDFFFLN